MTGPFTQEQLEHMVQRGQVSRLHELSDDRVSWKQAGRDDALFPKLVARPAVAKPPLPPPAAPPVHPTARAKSSEDEVELADTAGTENERRPTASAKASRQVEVPASAPPVPAQPGVPPVPAPSGRGWFYVSGGQPHGPIDEDALRQMSESGQLGPAAQVWTEGLTGWTSFDKIRLASVRASDQGFRYAGFCRRVAAFVLDQAVLFLLRVFVVGAVFFQLGYLNDLPDHWRDLTEHWVVVVQLNLLIIPLEWIYFSTLECSALRGTLGKLAMGLHVARMDGTPISFGQASGRYFGKWLSAALFCAGFISVAFDKQKQGLHDKIASTLVLRGTGADKLRYSGFWVRVSAFVLDQGVLFLVRILVVVAFFAQLGYLRDPREHWVLMLQLNLLIIPLEWVYFSTLECSSLHGTLGKRAMDIHVGRSDGTPVSFGLASGRYFGKWLSAALIGAGFISVAFDAKKRGLHDMIASTLVLDD